MPDKPTVVVDLDWSSTGLWVDGKNAGYADFLLPEWLIARFEYWVWWYIGRFRLDSIFSDADQTLRCGTRQDGASHLMKDDMKTFFGIIFGGIVSALAGVGAHFLIERLNREKVRRAKFLTALNELEQEICRFLNRLSWFRCRAAPVDGGASDRFSE